MTNLPNLRVRLMSKFVTVALMAVSTFMAACSSTTGQEAKTSILACAKAEENKIVGQATQALLTAAGKDPGSVTAFLDSLALDAAQAGVSDAIGFTTCVAEAVKAKLHELASHALLNPDTFNAIITNLDSWESAHRR
jgi:hypothetical protein